MKSSMKETKQPAISDSTTDHDLDDFVTKPGPSKNHWTTWRWARCAEYPKTHSVGTEDLHWLARIERSKCYTIQAKCPLGFLETQTPRNWIAGYLTSSWKPDARKVSRTYPTWMLDVLAALLSYGHSKSKLCPDLMDKDDPCSELSGTCDSIAQQLPKDGVGGSVKHAAIVTPDRNSGLL